MAKLNDEWIVQPHGALVEVAEGILTVEGSIVMPLGRFPRRMTVISLAEGGSAIWSPISLNEDEMARIDALGPVRFIIVPNRAHRLDLKPWTRRYPRARIITPPGGREAVGEGAKVDATDDVIHDAAIRFERVAGTKADEFALRVRRSDGTTLILNDILANVRHPIGLGANVMARLLGFGVDRPRTARPVRRIFVADPVKLGEQFRGWARIPDLRRVIVSHGDVIEVSPRAALETVAGDYVRA